MDQVIPADSVPCDRHPDFLKRFVPTPYTASFSTGSIAVQVETNEADWLCLFPGAAIDEGLPIRAHFLWRVVRDADLLGGAVLGPPVRLSSANLIILNMGPACLAGVDGDRRELFAFIGADVDDRIMQEQIIPVLLRETLAVVETNSAEGHIAHDIPCVGAIDD